VVFPAREAIEDEVALRVGREENGAVTLEEGGLNIEGVERFLVSEDAVGVLLMLVFIEQRGVEIRDALVSESGSLAGVIGDLIILVGGTAEETDAAGIVDDVG